MIIISPFSSKSQLSTLSLAREVVIYLHPASSAAHHGRRPTDAYLSTLHIMEPTPTLPRSINKHARRRCNKQQHDVVVMWRAIVIVAAAATSLTQPSPSSSLVVAIIAADFIFFTSTVAVAVIDFAVVVI